MCLGITHLPWVTAVQRSSAIEVLSRADLVLVFESLVSVITCCKNYIKDCGGSVVFNELADGGQGRSGDVAAAALLLEEKQHA